MCLLQVKRLLMLLIILVVAALIFYLSGYISTHQKPSSIHVHQNNYVRTLTDTSPTFNNFYAKIDNAKNIVSNAIGLTSNCMDYSTVLRASESDYFDKFASAVPDAQTVFFEVDQSKILSFLQNTTIVATSNDCNHLNVVSEGSSTCYQGFDSQTAVELPWSQIVDKPLDTYQFSDNEYVKSTYVHLIPNAMLDDKGDVVSENVKIISFRCSMHKEAGFLGRLFNSIATMFSKYPTDYDEVFAISQAKGEGYYHSTMENLPRLAVYLPYLQANPAIKIHANIKHKFLPLLGLDPARFISGTVRAKLLYLPAGSRCGYLPHTGGQLLSAALRDDREPEQAKRGVIVLIKRSHTRWFSHHNSILSMLNTYAAQAELSVVVYGDNPVPSVGETKDIFQRAVIVVAPHGAGISNMLFSQRGTVLIEGLCYDKSHRVNLCFLQACSVLGFTYHGLVYPHKQCMDITASDIEIPFLRYLKLLNYQLHS